MQIQQAKEYFELGVVTGFCAVRDPLVSGNWMLVVAGKEGNSWTLQTALGKVKSFASLDTLVKQVEGISGRVTSLDICT